MIKKSEPLKLVSSRSMTMFRSPMHIKLAEHYTLSETAVAGEELKYIIIGRQEEASVFNKYMATSVWQVFNYNNIIYNRFISNIVNRLSMLIKDEALVYYNSVSVSDKKNKNIKTSHISIKNTENFDGYKTVQIKNMRSGYDIHNIFKSAAGRIEAGSEKSKYSLNEKVSIYSLEERINKIKFYGQYMINNNILNISRIFCYKSFSHLYDMSWKTAENNIGSKYNILINKQLENMYYCNNLCNKFNRKYNNGILPASKTKNIRYSEAVKYDKYYNNSKYDNNSKSSNELEYINNIDYVENAEYKNKAKYSNIYNLYYSKKYGNGYKYTYKDSLYHAVEAGKYIYVTDRIMFYKSVAGKYGKNLICYFLSNNKLANLYQEGSVNKKEENHTSEYKNPLMTGELFFKNIININKDVIERIKKKYKVSIKRAVKNVKNTYATEMSATAEKLKIRQISVICNRLRSTLENTENIKVYSTKSKTKPVENIRIYSEGSMLKSVKTIKGSTLVYLEGNKIKHIKNIQTYWAEGILRSAKTIKRSTLVYLEGSKLKYRENIRTYWAGSILNSTKIIKGSTLVCLEVSKIKHTENIQTYWAESILKSVKLIEGNILKHRENIQTYSVGNILSSTEKIKLNSAVSMLSSTEKIKLNSAVSILSSTEKIKLNSAVSMLSSTEKIKLNSVVGMLSSIENIKKNLEGILSRYSENIKGCFFEYSLGKALRYTQNVQEHFHKSIIENLFNKNQQNTNREIKATQNVKSIQSINDVKDIERIQNINNEENADGVSSLTYLQSINSAEKIKSIIQSINHVQNISNIQSIKTGQAIQSLKDMEDVQNTDSLQTTQENVINRTKNIEDILLEQEKIQEINKMIDIRVQSQVKSISRQVYETIERKLQGEKRRRGF